MAVEDCGGISFQFYTSSCRKERSISIKKEKTFMKILLTCLFFFLIFEAGAVPSLTADANEDGLPDQWYELTDGRVTTLKVDRDYDGRMDYLVKYNKKGKVTYEEYDYNYDGLMDDYYFYDDGRLIRQEIDTNFDEKVDVWVYLFDGIYIEKLEQDSDFDGQIDLVQEYGP